MSRSLAQCTATVLLIGIGLVSCKKKGEIEAVDTGPPPPVVLPCAEGTWEFGFAPPQGFEMYCGYRDAAGTAHRNGPAVEWYRDGRTKAYGAFADDVKVGRWWMWTADGALESEGEFLEGRASGYWIHYGPDEQIVEEGPMVKGGRHGLWVTHDNATGVPQTGQWVEGERDGVWIEFDLAGEPLRERVYRRGRLINQREL